jgi:hypothetical protein
MLKFIGSYLAITTALLLVAGCATAPQRKPAASAAPTQEPTVLTVSGVPAPAGRTFSEDVAFLKQHTRAVVLENGGGKVVVVPEYQGRVMTSSVGGMKDLSFGWLNYDIIAGGVRPAAEVKGKLEEHIYVFGGEERFWLGPEGGQYAIYFEKGEPFDFDHWNTPPLIDTEPFKLVKKSESEAVFRRAFKIANFSGYTFKGMINRRVNVLDRTTVARQLKVELPDSVSAVAYQTRNALKNTGPTAWTRETGLLSIWLLGMYKPGANTTVVIPFKPGPEAKLGPIVNDTYFGKVPADRLIIGKNILFFSGDGTYRSKIGLTARRAKGIAGSYDADNRVLTIVTYNRKPADGPYVNSMWELQDEPYAGDVINSYNDGPPKPGAKPLGPFYELETSSPGAELEPGKSIVHIQKTAHLVGPEKELDAIAKKLLGVSLEAIKTALK